MNDDDAKAVVIGGMEKAKQASLREVMEEMSPSNDFCFVVDVSETDMGKPIGKHCVAILVQCGVMATIVRLRDCRVMLDRHER